MIAPEDRVARLPLTVIGGFLGAGKTTLVNHLLAHAQGERIVVLVNDFGAVNIDASLIAARDGSQIALTNGCACCAIGDDFGRAIATALRRDPRPDHLVVEASGVSDPGALAEIAILDPELSPGGVIVLVDHMTLPQLANDARIGDAVRRQIAAADLLVLTKGDVASEAERAATIAHLRELAPATACVEADWGRLPVELVIGPKLPSRDPLRKVAAGGVHAGLFATTTIYPSRPIDETTLRAALEALPGDVLRIKGFVPSHEEASPWLVQRVGRRLEISLCDMERDQVMALVMIGTEGVFAAARQLEELGFRKQPPRRWRAEEA
ncbi:GTPase, G3E family [Rhizobiales bacterium GAS191]|nr:GTPase, G3E family [Rhizobiales bacterium GAS191]